MSLAVCWEESEPQNPAPSLAASCSETNHSRGIGSQSASPNIQHRPCLSAAGSSARIYGTVVVAAVIDEHGDVVRAHAISGHPLLIPAALGAVLQWNMSRLP